jgi:hypothetical protein
MPRFRDLASLTASVDQKLHRVIYPEVLISCDRCDLPTKEFILDNYAIPGNFFYWCRCSQFRTISISVRFRPMGQKI